MNKRHYTIVVAPGHRGFIQNHLARCTQTWVTSWFQQTPQSSRCAHTEQLSVILSCSHHTWNLLRLMMGALASSQRSSQTGEKARETWRKSRISNFDEALDDVRSLWLRDDESRSQGEDGQEARPAQCLQCQLRDGWAQMRNLQIITRSLITRALSNESNQATDNVSSRQTAPADQSQQSSPDTPSPVSDCASEATIQGWIQQHSRLNSLSGVKLTSS